MFFLKKIPTLFCIFVRFFRLWGCSTLMMEEGKEVNTKKKDRERRNIQAESWCIQMCVVCWINERLALKMSLKKLVPRMQAQSYSWLIFEGCPILSACSFAWLMPGLCLKNEVYTECRALVPSRDLCRIFA